MGAGSNELRSIAELLAEVDTLVQILYGTESQPGLLADLKASNAEFSERMSQLRELLRQAKEDLGGAVSVHLPRMDAQIEQLKEAADIFSALTDRLDPSVFAEACINIMKPGLLEPMALELKAQATETVVEVGEALAASISARIQTVVQDAVVIRRDEIVAEVVAAVHGELSELEASRELAALQQRYAFQRKLMYGCAAGTVLSIIVLLISVLH